MQTPFFAAFFADIAAAFSTPTPLLMDITGRVVFEDCGALASWYPVNQLASESVGAAGLALAHWMATEGDAIPAVCVNRRLASLWFGSSVQAVGWRVPPMWGALSGDYQTRDGWIRLHTNAPLHHAAAVAVLGDAKDADKAMQLVSTWYGQDLEEAIVAAGGCAAVMHSTESWLAHAQGKAIGSQALVAWEASGEVKPVKSTVNPARPLRGIRVLDMTRILAGPVATRFLAACGADVLRIDPPGWDEPSIVADITVGKRCAGLDLRAPADRQVFERLLATADVLVHGYRPEALARLGYSTAQRQAINPALIDVTLNAYGWAGPWVNRRGFDSLVQMSSGIAEYGRRQEDSERPFPLPAQALDHATGYFMAAAVLHALRARREAGMVYRARLSLARTAHLLLPMGQSVCNAAGAAPGDDDYRETLEQTPWGSARRLRFPLSVAGFYPGWHYAAGELRRHVAAWL